MTSTVDEHHAGDDTSQGTWREPERCWTLLLEEVLVVVDASVDLIDLNRTAVSLVIEVTTVHGVTEFLDGHPSIAVLFDQERKGFVAASSDPGRPADRCSGRRVHRLGAVGSRRSVRSCVVRAFRGSAIAAASVTDPFRIVRTK